MRKIGFDQGTEAWLEWRRNFITASDAAILLGLSPYETPYQGWQRKKGLIPEKEATPAMLRGHHDEPIARDLFIREHGINMTPCCIESDDYNFIGASLDGISDCGKYILEVKSQRPVDHVPEFHMMQMQHQMIACDGAIEKCFYVSHWEGVNKTFVIYPDLEWKKMYLPKAKEYWKGVVFNEPPPLTSKDYLNMGENAKWCSYSNEYKKLCDQIKHLEEIKEGYRKELIDLCGENSCSGAGIKIVRKIVKGRVDYEEMFKVLNITEESTNRFRKPNSQQWCIVVDK